MKEVTFTDRRFDFKLNYAEINTLKPISLRRETYWNNSTTVKVPSNCLSEFCREDGPDIRYFTGAVFGDSVASRRELYTGDAAEVVAKNGGKFVALVGAAQDSLGLFCFAFLDENLNRWMSYEVESIRPVDNSRYIISPQAFFNAIYEEYFVLSEKGMLDKDPLELVFEILDKPAKDGINSERCGC